MLKYFDLMLAMNHLKHTYHRKTHTHILSRKALQKLCEKCLPTLSQHEGTMVDSCTDSFQTFGPMVHSVHGRHVCQQSLGKKTKLSQVKFVCCKHSHNGYVQFTKSKTKRFDHNKEKKNCLPKKVWSFFHSCSILLFLTTALQVQVSLNLRT
jgi:hypothetical protein